MEYDFRNRTSSPYTSTVPSHGRIPSAAAPSIPDARPVYNQHPPSLYPHIGGTGSHSTSANSRNPPPFHHAPTPPPPSGPGMGIRVAVKQEYRITPPPNLLPQLGEIPRSNFHFDFEFERNVLIEAVKEKPNWSRLGIEIAPPKPTPSFAPKVDPLVSKYIAAGLNREAVPLAVANFGDNPSKVKEFCNGYTLLQEMGFPSNNVAEALLMYDNDTDKALAHFLNSTT